MLLCAPWNRDNPADLPIIEERLRTLLTQIATEAPNRVVPAVDMAREWHRVIHTGLSIWTLIRLCALAHGEWVRIHPFANGNGRTARPWANWCGLRYELPPFIRLRPRPNHQRYAYAAAQSMRGNHDDMAPVFLDMLHHL
jgi:Fic family protein